MTRQQIETELLDAVDRFEGRLPVEQLQDMRELVRAGEPGLALENLCTQAHEYDVTVPNDVVAKLSRLGSAMGIDKKYSEDLKTGHS
jgi:hypothetical protein